MTPPRVELKHFQTTKRLIGLFFEVYNELGHGFLESVYLESVYEEAFAVALQESGLKFERQKLLEVWFRGRLVGSFRADVVVEDAVLVELKAARVLGPTHEAQLLNYLLATNLTVGLVLNFGPRPKFLRRIVEKKRTQIGVKQ